MRRLPVYILINNSSSMQGEGIEAANAGLSMLISSLRQNPYALESVYLRIHSYAKESQTILPLMSLEDVQFHNLQCSQFSESNLGHSLEELELIIRNELNQGSVMTKKADWSPLLILITDGGISDSEHFYNILPKFKRINFADILILIVGYGKNLSFLKIKELSKNIVQMDTMDSNNFSAFFKWVSQNIENNSQGILEKDKTYEVESEKDKRKSNFEILKNLIAKKEEKLSLKKSAIIQEAEIKKEEKEEEISSPAQIIEIELIEESIKQSNLK